jgi:hypothetical protein
VKKTLRLNAITAMISDQGNAGHDPKTTQKTNCPNQISTKDWTTSTAHAEAPVLQSLH